MSMLYVTDNGSSIGMSGGSIMVKYPDNHEEKVPRETVDAISIFGRSQISTQAVQYCLLNGIRLGYFSQNGSFYGYLQPAERENIAREKKQFALTDDSEQCLQLAKMIITAKVNNQITIVRRLFLSKGVDALHELNEMGKYRHKIEGCTSIPQVLGYEGLASRQYFSLFSKIYGDKWRFRERSGRPAQDPINSMLNMGYSMLHKEIVGELIQHGVNPYAGFIHQDKVGHASLASDLIEEWRAIIVDAVVIKLINDDKVSPEDFSYEAKECKINREAIKLLLYKMEQKIQTKASYLADIKKELSFRETIGHQCEQIARCIDDGDLSSYSTIRTR